MLFTGSDCLTSPMRTRGGGRGVEFSNFDIQCSCAFTSATKSTVSFSKVVLSQGDVNKVFLGVFLMFSAFFHSKIWANFHFGTFE